MARPKKKGLDYFPFDVDFFTDRKIKIVWANYGADGVLLYVYLICAVYKNGYFLRLDDDFFYMINADLGMGRQKTEQILNFFLKRSLFDDKLFKTDKILTSVGIQRRYQEAVASRAAKNPVYVDAALWLLDERETLKYISEFPENGYSENNPQSKVKEIKLNESKVNADGHALPAEHAEHADTYGQHVHLTADEYDSLVRDYGEKKVREYIGKVDRYIEASGKKPYSSHFSTITDWMKKDGVDRKSAHSYDLEAIIQHAIDHTPKINPSG